MCITADISSEEYSGKIPKDDLINTVRLKSVIIENAALAQSSVSQKTTNQKKYQKLNSYILVSKIIYYQSTINCHLSGWVGKDSRNIVGSWTVLS